jgi:hypothetical protein
MLAKKPADLLGKALAGSRELRVAPLLRWRPIRSPNSVSLARASHEP